MVFAAHTGQVLFQYSDLKTQAAVGKAVGVLGDTKKISAEKKAVELRTIDRLTRLDVADDRQQLQATIAAVRPILLVLDPFVRLHRIDENAASAVARLLAYLRELQRRFALAVVVHHARNGAHALRAAQALRGSSEFHAWGDSNLYLRRIEDRLLLSIEHRAAPSQTGLPLALSAVDDALALHIVDATGRAGVALPLVLRHRYTPEP
jgi:hypothetical protein